MALMEDKYDAKESRKSLYFVKQIYMKTKLDGSFQRWGGYNRGSGWSLKAGISYLQNLILGATFNTIINVDVEAALAYSKEEGCEQSIEYYSGILEEGYEYVSADGNNSASFVTAFLNSEKGVKIKSGASNTRSFSEFPEEEQASLQYEEKIRFIVLRKILVHELCDLFRALNESTHLNNQEYRQARCTHLSKFVRELVKGEINGANRDAFLKLVYNNELDLDKRSHEEIVAQLALKLSENFNTDLRKANLDSFYEDNFWLSPIVEKHMTSIFKDLAQLAQTLETPLQRKLTKGALHILFDLIQLVTLENDFTIIDHGKFFEWFLDNDARFRVEAGKVVEDEKEKKSYSHWSTFYQNSEFYGNTRCLFKECFMRALPELIDNRIVEAARRSKDSFTWKQKMELWYEQDYRTRTGEEINALDLYLGKYEADHVKSFKDGGETTIQNGELMTVQENRSKGSTSNEPHFPHQQR